MDDYSNGVVSFVQAEFHVIDSQNARDQIAGIPFFLSGSPKEAG